MLLFVVSISHKPVRFTFSLNIILVRKDNDFIFIFCFNSQLCFLHCTRNCMWNVKYLSDWWNVLVHDLEIIVFFVSNWCSFSISISGVLRKIVVSNEVFWHQCGGWILQYETILTWSVTAKNASWHLVLKYLLTWQSEVFCFNENI